MTTTIKILTSTGEFAEDKDAAALLREKQIRPALQRGERVVIDFDGVTLATQSFVHALISDMLRTQGEKALSSVEFKRCQRGVRGIVETVVQYSLESRDIAEGNLDGIEGSPKKRTAEPRKKK
jgi:hypothetical protein